MRTTQDDGFVVETDAYRLRVDQELPVAELSEPDGANPMRLFLLASLETERGMDGTLTHGPPTVVRFEGGATIAADQASTTWDAKQVRLRCTPDEVAFEVTVRGSGRLRTVRLLGGGYTGNPRWGGGQFHSAWSARTLFVPSPDDPNRIVQPAAEPATIGVVGGSLPGRGHWFFTPAPFLVAGHPELNADPATADGWQTFELRCSAAEATFTELRHAAFLGGFSFELAYEGQTTVDDIFTTPTLAIRMSRPPPYAALAEHAEWLRAAGNAPMAERAERPRWWTRPIFCGWGEQNRVARAEGVDPTSLSRRDRYDAWLDHLEQRGVVPGTVVIDDRWQTTYGRNEPDPERWPDLRGWIADRHARGQRVLLWFKAWDPEGLPVDACVTDVRGTPVSADPSSPAYQRILRTSLRDMLGPDGLDADGLKVDFTAQGPSGDGLRRVGDAWGVALLHRLCELVYRFAKEAEPDALVVAHTASPLFTDVTDMIRLNDLLRLSDPDPVAPAVAQMTHRARVASSIEPGMLIDTDDWCMPSLAEWRAYLAAKPGLGVPALYYATGLDYSGEPFTDADYAAIRSAWAEYEARRVQGSG
jgi:hypothetical protein